MGQIHPTPREPVLIDDLKVGSCFKYVEGGGDGPYNYCRKLVKKTHRRKAKYYDLETDHGSEYRQEGTVYKKCSCPKTRKKQKGGNKNLKRGGGRRHR